MYISWSLCLSVCVSFSISSLSISLYVCLCSSSSLPHSLTLSFSASVPISMSVSVSLCVAVSLSPSSLYHSSVRFFLHHAILCFYVSSFFIRSCVSLLYCVLYNHDHNFLDPKINTGTRVKTEAKIRINNG